MCGIAALQLRNPPLHPSMGSLLSSMLCQIVDRGPDSAGLAVYNTPRLVAVRLIGHHPDRPADADDLAAVADSSLPAGSAPQPSSRYGGHRC